MNDFKFQELQAELQANTDLKEHHISFIALAIAKVNIPNEAKCQVLENLLKPYSRLGDSI